MRHGNKHRVGSPAVRTGANLFHKLTTCWVKRLYGTKSQAFLAALLNGVAGVEPGAFQLADHEQLQADRAATENKDCLVRVDARFLDRFNDGVNWLDESRFLKSHIIGEGHDAAFGHPGHRLDIFSEPASVGCEAGSKSSRLVLLALREEALFAIEAPAAGRMVKTHDAIARRPLRDATSHGNNRAGKFMAENLRRLDVALKDFLDVRAAYPAGGYFDEHFPRAHFGNRHFLDSDQALFAEDSRAHGPRNWRD